MMASHACIERHKFNFEHVKPGNVNGRFINAELVMSPAGKSLLVHEFVQDRDDSVNNLCPTLYQTYTVPLPDDLVKGNDRLLGNIVCICASGQIMIFQYSTVTDKFTKFVMTNVENKSVLLFSDGQNYFRREYGISAPLQCITSLGSDCRHCLICLPTRTLRETAKSVIYEILFQTSVAATSLTCTNTGCVLHEVNTLQVDECKEWFKRANTCTNIVPHPLIHGCVVIVQANPDTGKISIYMDSYRYCKRKSDKASPSNDKGATVRLFDYYKDVLDDSDLDRSSFYHFYINQVNTVCSRSGDLICVCCLVRHDKSLGFERCVTYYVSILLLDLEILRVLAAYTSKVRKTKQYLNGFDDKTMIIPVFSRCDTKIMALCATQNSSMFKKLLTNSVTREPNLKRMCRAVIIQCTKTSDIVRLGLPTSLKDYVSFTCIA